MSPPILRVVIAAACTSAAAFPAAAQQSPKSNDVEIVGHVLEPEQVQPTDERVAGLDVPDGFRIHKFAEGLINPRMLAVAGDGTVYVTRRDIGDVVMLRDTDGDGSADERRIVASRPNMHGIAIDGRRIWLATIKEVYAADIREDGTLGELRPIIDDLPDAGQHPNRTLAIGPDGKLYITVGSTCNACAEDNPENATILQAEPDGSRHRIFASGLRNTIGFDWHPATGALYGFDHGIDWLGDEEQKEEFNRIEDGRRYGWPYIYADGRQNPADEPPADIPMEQWASLSQEPELLYTAHAAPMQMAFHDGTAFPAEYRGDAFAAMRGSWNRKPPSGYEVVRVRFQDGRPQSIEPFVTGFLVERDGGRYEQMGRLAGLAVAPDGSILFSDDENGVIYRVAYEGGEVAAASGGTETGVSGSSAAQAPASGASQDGSPDQIAIALLDARTDDPLPVSSPAFQENQPIPGTFAEEGQGISPPLTWAAGPEGTKSYVVLAEDPDASSPKPFVHWVLYNLPPDLRSLREGVPSTPKLQLPEGALQGANSYGSTGYYGMKPPAGAEHRYHFQVFALDRMLDLPPGADRQAVLDAMEGHVLGEGRIIGTYSSS
jgi:Raf kinase inhibitor-like YbhB/YbcL family protein